MLSILAAATCSFAAGSGLTFGFRGFVNRLVNKAKKAVLADVTDAHLLLSGAAGKTEAELRAAVDTVRMRLAKWL